MTAPSVCLLTENKIEWRSPSPKVPSQPARKETPFLELTLKGHEEPVYDVAFIVGTRLLVTGSADKSLRVWDLDTGKQEGEPLLGHDAEVWSVAASPDGRWIVSGGWNGSILVWEVATNKKELKRVPLFPLRGHGGTVSSIVFATDSQTFASASWDDTVCVWKRETGKIVIATGKELLKIEQRAFNIAFTPDGLRLVSGNSNDIRISDATTGDIIKQFDAHTENFFSLAIAPNGTKFATTSFDNTTRFFDLTTFEPIGELLEHPDAVRGVAFSEDSQLIATGCADKLVRTW
ncbi:WD40-repeat-containing domain protein, partial [Suillus bovinus]|uniref:WD40-repeat-containing domain protein n=1 Tax=Suillus bovinus TaxID=48563 RepID=UPI001B874236